MNQRILHLFEPAHGSPFLSAQAAANHWLPPALRGLDHEVVARPIAGNEPETLTELSKHFDVVHVFGELPEGCRFSAPVVQTVWQAGSPAPAHPEIAASWVQARARRRPPVGVVPPGIPVHEVDAPTERGDHFATVLNPSQAAQLEGARRVAHAVERELVVLSGEPLPLPADPLVRNVVVPFDQIPTELLSAAAYISATADPADIAAVTALAAGVPVLALEGSAAAEIVVSGESGFVCRGVEEMSRAAERLELLSPKLGRARARLLFDVDGWAQRVATLYTAVAEGRPARFRHPERLAAV